MINLRKANIEDCRFIFDVRNEKSTRESSFCADKLDYQKHSEWFKRALKSKDKIIYIIENNGERVGFLRIDKIFEVSIAIDKNKRGNGFAIESLEKIESFVKGNMIAKIKINNKKSINLFKKAGYEFENIKDKYKVMIKKRD